MSFGKHMPIMLWEYWVYILAGIISTVFLVMFTFGQ